MATIEKRMRADGKTPSYRVTIKRGLNGRRIRKTFQKKALAEAFAREQEGSVDAMRASARAVASGKTLADAILAELDDVPGRDRSKADRLAWWSARFGHLTLADFHEGHVADGIESLWREKGPDGKRRRAAATVNRYHTSLSAVLQYARRRRWVTRNVAREVPKLKEPKGRTRWLDEHERARLFAACEAGAVPSWFTVWLLVLVTTGMRRGEAYRLTWADVDLDRGLVRILHTKTDEPRTAPLLPEVVDALRPLRGLPAAPVFPMRGYFTPDHWWRLVTAEAGLANVRVHDLRHTAASVLAQSNASDLTIAALLGHSTLAMVKRYSHHRVDAVRDQVADAWRGGVR